MDNACRWQDGGLLPKSAERSLRTSKRHFWRDFSIHPYIDNISGLRYQDDVLRHGV